MNLNWEANIRRLHFRGRTLLAIPFVLAAAAPAGAQQDENPDSWKVSAEFSLTDQSGNKDLALLTSGLNFAHLRREDYRLDGSFQSRYGRSDGEVVAKSHTGTIAFDLRPEGTFTPFLTMNGERDEPKRLNLRLSTGAGAKYTLHRGASGNDEISLSLALLHSYERIGIQQGEPGATDLDPADVKHLARWSLRGRTNHQIRQGVTFRHTTFYQPVWGELADYLLRSDTGVKILLTERLALSVDYQLKREARPPEGIEPNDRLLKTGLIIDF